MFSIHRKLFLALELSKPLLVRFPSPGKKLPPVKFLISPSLRDISSKPYRYLENLIPSHLLKVTKFLVKTSQFKFLVKIEENIFCV